jgi:anti-sigma factor RsiW
MMTLTCETLLTYLSDYIDGELSDELVLAAREHMATCDNCRVVLNTTERTIALYRSLGEVTLIQGDRYADLLSTLQDAFHNSRANHHKAE